MQVLPMAYLIKQDTFQEYARIKETELKKMKYSVCTIYFPQLQCKKYFLII